MKNIVKLIGIIAIVAVIGFLMTACGDKDASKTIEDVVTKAVYKGMDAAANIYELVISKAQGRAAYDPTVGDDYVMTVTPPNGAGKKSEGAVDQSVDGGYSLKPRGATKVFNVAVDGGNIIAMAGEIKYTSGNPEEKAVVMTPSAVGGTTITKAGNVYTIASGVDVAYDPKLANLTAAKAVTSFPYVLDLGGGGDNGGGGGPGDGSGGGDGGSGGGDGGGEGGGPSGVNMTTVLDGETKIEVTNSKVTIKVGTPKDQVLQSFPDFMAVTPNDVKYFGSEGGPAAFTNVEGTPENYDSMYGLICVKGTENIAGLTYVSKDATIKGTDIHDGIVEIIDINVKAGWNYVFTSSYGQYKIYSASQTLPAGYKWTVIDQNTEINLGQGENSGSPVIGTWVNVAAGNWQVKMTNDGIYEQSEGGKLMEKGRFNLEGTNTFKCTTTSLSDYWIQAKGWWKGSEQPKGNWYDQNGLSSYLTSNGITGQTVSNYFKNNEAWTYTLNGDTMILKAGSETITLTRKKN